MKKEFGENVGELEISFGDVFEIKHEGEVWKRVVIDTSEKNWFSSVAFSRTKKGKLLVNPIPGTGYFSYVERASGETLSLEQIIEGTRNFVRKHKQKIPNGYLKHLWESSKRPPVRLIKEV